MFLPPVEVGIGRKYDSMVVVATVALCAVMRAAAGPATVLVLLATMASRAVLAVYIMVGPMD